MDVGGSINAIVTFYSTSMAAIRAYERFGLKKAKSRSIDLLTIYLVSHLMGAERRTTRVNYCVINV